MRFDRHLFISYAHLDNQPLTPGDQGWVSRFHDTLAALLSMRLGTEARIWRDDKLQGNDDFDAEIVAQFTQTAVLVAVLTPRYVKSEWCNREIGEFCEAAERTGGALVENKSRVFKVIKSPVENQDTLPDAAKKVLGYEFFVIQDDHTPLELDPDYGDEFAQGFKQKVAALAYQVSLLVSDLESAPDESADETSASAGDRPAVYLAECSSDRRDERELLEGELRRLGYPVLPDERLPSDEEEYLLAVDALLQRCELSVHLVGGSYGLVPDGPTMKSVVIHQNEAAVARSRSANLPRLIWLPATTRTDNELQQQFVDSLHYDADAQFGADLITADIEALRTTIHATLARIELAPSSADADLDGDAGADRPKRVYLMCDREDRRATVPIRKFLDSLGVEADLPAFEGDASRVRDANVALLEGCDAIIVFYGSGDEAWKRTIDSDLRKLPGYTARRSIPAVFTYLAEPRTDDKDDLVDMEEPNLIVGIDSFDESSMADLVAILGVDRGAR